MSNSIDEMPPIMKAVCGRIMTLGDVWHEAKGLFAFGDARTRVLNEVAPGFFAILQEVVVDYLFVALCVLDSNAKSAGHDQESFRGMLHEVNGELSRDSVAANAVMKLLNEFHAIVEKEIRPHRDRRIAHADAALSLGVDTLKGVKYETLERAVVVAFGIFNMAAALRKTRIPFENPPIDGDHAALVLAMEASIRFDKLDHWLCSADLRNLSGSEVRDQIREKFISPPCSSLNLEDQEQGV